MLAENLPFVGELALFSHCPNCKITSINETENNRNTTVRASTKPSQESNQSFRLNVVTVFLVFYTVFLVHTVLTKAAKKGNVYRQLLPKQLKFKTKSNTDDD